jgi:hypothetical protein
VSKYVNRLQIRYAEMIILPCVVFAKIIPIAALGVFTKRIRRSEWRFLAFCLAWCSPRSSQAPRLVFLPSAYGGWEDHKEHLTRRNKRQSMHETPPDAKPLLAAAFKVFLN